MLAGASETKADALAEIGESPAAIKAGKARNPEPPASALIKPAMMPTAKRKEAVASVISVSRDHEPSNSLVPDVYHEFEMRAALHRNMNDIAAELAGHGLCHEHTERFTLPGVEIIRQADAPIL